MLETITQVNFGIGFSNTKSDVLIHLAQWQYWWWFWFSFLWSFYYLLILRVLRFRTLKFRPRIVTSYRPHGKWGDLIICLIPVSWCANIITNSNFILRMIEWQAEAGLFTFRIRAKQWYWIYKFELKTLTDIIGAPKNIGRNKWVITTPSDVQVSEDYLHVLQLRSQNKWIQKYWTKDLEKNTKTDQFHVASAQELLAFNFKKRFNTLTNNSFLNETSLFLDSLNLNLTYAGNKELSNLHDNLFVNFLTRINNKKKAWAFNYINNNKQTYLGGLVSDEIFLQNADLFNTRKTQKAITKSLYNQLPNLENPQNVFYYSDFSEINRFFKRSSGPNMPVRLIKYPITTKSDFDFNNDVTELFRFRFDEATSNTKHKPVPHSTFLLIKQKRYKRRKIILPRIKNVKASTGKLTKLIKHTSKPVLLDNEIIAENDLSATKQYKMLKKKKKRYEGISVVLSRRLLRTKRTLVLPAHVNLTAITNSYDIVHSWWIPGLGLKMDCIPGRSTHHTFYVDNVGFYYGQCAEICGRFHHHMPIRLCALPFEHFLIWWHSFGLPKLVFTKPKKNYQTYYGFRKYVW